MKPEQTTEYVTAFIVGTLVGVGAALLFAPSPPTRREKILKELKPYRRKIRKTRGRAKKQVSRGAAAATEWSDELVAAARAVAKDLREEIADMVAEARDQIGETVQTQVESAQDALRRGAKRARS